MIRKSFIASFIDSTVGGGGLISTPALLSLGLPVPYALGTNKLAAFIGCFTSVISFWRAGKIKAIPTHTLALGLKELKIHAKSLCCMMRWQKHHNLAVLARAFRAQCSVAYQNTNPIPTCLKPCLRRPRLTLKPCPCAIACCCCC